MYKIEVWSVRDHVWQVVAKNLTPDQAAAMWRRMYNNGVNPRIVKETSS